MTKLYRFVPDFLATYLKTNFIGSSSLEDVFYDEGLMNINDMKSPHLHVSGEKTGYVYPLITNKAFFFTNPYSIIRAFEYQTKFSSDILKVLEYDIPDEIVSSSEKACARYINYAPMGVLIDIDLLHDGQEVSLDKDRASKDMLKGEREVISYITKATGDNRFESLSDEELLSLNRYRLVSETKLYKSKYLTGNKCFVSIKDMRSLVPDILDKENKPEDFTLLCGVNNIFTKEMYDNFDLDIPDSYTIRVKKS